MSAAPIKQDKNPTEVVLGLFASKESGEVTVDKLERECSGYSRQDIVATLKKAATEGQGLFISGRKGHPSRWIYGTGVDAERRKMDLRNNRQNSSAPMVTSSGNEGLCLRINIGGQIQEIPINVEMVHSAG